MGPLVVESRPAPGCAAGLAPDHEWKSWPIETANLRRCFVCKRHYRNVGFAWRCERWHWGDNGERR